MSMILAGNADIGWDRKKKNWIVSIHIGEQVIKRPSDKRVSQNADDDLLRAAEKCRAGSRPKAKAHPNLWRSACCRDGDHRCGFSTDTRMIPSLANEAGAVDGGVRRPFPTARPPAATDPQRSLS